VLRVHAAQQRGPLSLETRLRRLSPGRRRAVDAIVRLILPTYPGLGESERSRVQVAVTDFVASQVEGLPVHLAVPYRWGLTAFEWLALLRFGSRFSALNRPSQVAYLKLWADFPIGLPRDFVKLIRSCALLASFDHPEVISLRPRGPVAATGELHVD
jgi:hypothetical protein